jgi:D-psicose/D-tagatose/L-ribulose 3-epimerase
MRLAVSNIAWARHDDPQVFALLRELGADGVEVAPTVVWPEWNGATTLAADAYRRRLASEGFEVPALQAILFGRPELQLFASNGRRALFDHFVFVADLATALGAKVLVFGAPKNRRRGPLDASCTVERAADVLRRIGEICLERAVVLGLEPNPVEYGCDFVTNVTEARELVDRIAHPGVQLHLDAGAMTLTGGNIADAIASAGPFVHYHASEPMLDQFCQPRGEHAAAGRALRAAGYDRWISIEMRRAAAELPAIRQAIAYVLKAYFPERPA